MGLVATGDFNRGHHNPFDGYRPRPEPVKPMGDLTSFFSNLLGEKNAANLLTTAQTAATTYAINSAGQYVQQNPDAVKSLNTALQSSSKGVFEQAWQDYKIPIVVLTGLLVVGVGFAAYRTFKK